MYNRVMGHIGGISMILMDYFKKQVRIKTVGVLVFALFFGLSGLSQANVSLKNGNFYIGYLTMIMSGGIEPKIELVYNSKSSFDGPFGFGWGYDYAVKVAPTADGSVLVYENGGGAHNRFEPVGLNDVQMKAAIGSAVDKILAAKKKAGMTSQAAKDEKTRLTTNARYRDDEFGKLFEKGLIQGSNIKNNTVFKSNKYSYQTLKKTSSGYVRVFDAGQVQSFDNRGRIVRIADKNRNYLTFKYNKAGFISSMQDNLNRVLNIQTNGGGQITKVSGPNKKTAIFQYKGNELASLKDSDGNLFKFQYSSNGRHNLVEVEYSDGTKTQVGYHPLNKCENVQWVKRRDKTLKKYNYTGNCAGGLERTTEVVAQAPNGNVLSKSKYTYHEKIKLSGERYTYKLGSEIDGDKTETVYNECCGLPLVITHNGEKTSFQYDKKGHVVKKLTPDEVTELAYDSRTSKVSKVVKYSTKNKSKKGVKWAQYKYDSKGNLEFAKNSEGKTVKIVYDHYGRIRALVDQSKRRLEFTYNEASRPVVIQDPKVGKITVMYSNSGEIKQVKSSGGRKIALQVTSAFQNLLDIIRPAGVTLSF